MRTIWKYAIGPGVTRLDMPRGAEVLDVQVQLGQPVLWAVVDDEAPTLLRTFFTAGTGHRLPEATEATLEYVATFQLEGGTLVFHTFEVVS